MITGRRLSARLAAPRQRQRTAQQCRCSSRPTAPGAPRVAFSVFVAADAPALRAAGYLRAQCFYSYPPGRSEFSQRQHRRMKGDAEWASVTAKVQGREPEYRQMRVTALVAAIPDVAGCSVAAAAAAELDASTKLPADGPRPPQLVVGSLDLNQGAVLPAEELVGRQPDGGQAVRRAYLSNVCVAVSARRQGIAAALMQQAEELAAAQGVCHLYVHVVADNTAAAALYAALGYEAEAQESEAFARALRRPRRLLLHKQLG